MRREEQEEPDSVKLEGKSSAATSRSVPVSAVPYSKGSAVFPGVALERVSRTEIVSFVEVV